MRSACYAKPATHTAFLLTTTSPGFGHTVRYLDRTRVSRYVALEPNPLMHAKIRGEASARGFHESDGSLVVLGCGAEDTDTILAALAPPTSPADRSPAVDTIVSVLTLCTVPEPQRAVEGLVRAVLKPGRTAADVRAHLEPPCGRSVVAAVLDAAVGAVLRRVPA